MSEFYEGLAEILEVEVGEVNSDLALDEGNWDSLAIVSTIALIDEVYDKTISGEALENCKTVGDLEKAVEAA
ncbi:acyl carrier protein [Candidatus Sumerlaeota bacterium]|nr:acyl carrier protein [Candidatus Sumerlaeota bacterium]